MALIASDAVVSGGSNDAEPHSIAVCINGPDGALDIASAAERKASVGAKSASSELALQQSAPNAHSCNDCEMGPEAVAGGASVVVEMVTGAARRDELIPS